MLFKIQLCWWRNLLFKLELYIINEHFKDGPDKLAGIVDKGIIMCSSRCAFVIIISFESNVIFYNIML